MLRGARWIVLWVGIAVVDENCWWVAARKGANVIGSSKPVAAVPDVSAAKPRY
jgi:hypothetical protein